MKIIKSNSYKKIHKISAYDPYPYGYWMDENGKLIDVGMMQHGKIARDMLRNEMTAFAKSKNWDPQEYISTEAYNYAFDKSWIRIVNPNSKSSETGIEFYTITSSQIGPLLKLIRDHYKYVREDMRTFNANITLYNETPKKQKSMLGRQFDGTTSGFDYPKTIEFLSAQVSAPKEPWGPINKEKPNILINSPKEKKKASAQGWYAVASNIKKCANLEIFHGFPYGYWITPDGTFHVVDTEQHTAKVAELIPKDEAFASMHDAYDAAFQKGFVRTVGPYVVYHAAEIGIQIPHKGKSITQDQYFAIESLLSRASRAVYKDPRLTVLRVNLDYGFEIYPEYYTTDKALEKLRENIMADRKKPKSKETENPQSKLTTTTQPDAKVNNDSAAVKPKPESKLEPKPKSNPKKKNKKK